MAVIRPDDLPAASSVNPAAALVVDDGSAVEKATPLQVVDAAIPLASQAEAEAGVNNVKRVTPLRVYQAIVALGVSAAALIDSAGSALVGFIQAGDGAVPTDVQTVLRAFGINPAHYSNGFTGAAARQVATIVDNGGGGFNWTGAQSDMIVVDPGIYTDVDALDGAASLFGIEGRFANSVTLDRRDKDDYLFERDEDALGGTSVRNLNVWGGKGLLRLNPTDVNVQAFQVIEKMVLMDYSECAISSASVDSPYWKLSQVIFRGADDSISLALAGKYDASSVIDCEFHNGKYGIKCVGERSSAMSVERTSFFTIRPLEDFSANPDHEADVWIGPAPTFAFAGAATVLSQCKFGNENMSLDKPRILFADEDADSGDSVATRSHSEDPSTGYVDGFSLLDSAIFGLANLTAPIMRSFTANVSRLKFEGNILGAPYTYLLEYMGTEGAEDTYITRTNFVRLGAPPPGERSFQTAVSNRLMGVIEDPFGRHQDDPFVELNGFGDDTSFTELARLQGYAGTVGGGPTKALVASAFKGSPNAAEVTFGANGSRSSAWYCDLATVTPNTQSRLVVHLKHGATLPLGSIGYELYNTVSNKAAIVGTAVIDAATAPDGVRLDMKWVPHVGNTGNWRLVIYALDYLAATRTKVQIGTVSVYHSRTWMNDGDIRTIGYLAWDDTKIRDKGGSIWRDSSGQHRYLRSAEPTSELNGYSIACREPQTVATLVSQGGVIGDIAYATNGRKSGEGAASGTGCPAYRDASGAWRTFYDNSVLAA